MYIIRYEGKTVYDPRLLAAGAADGASYAVETAQLDTGVGSAGSLTFTLAPGHSMIDEIEPMRGVIKAARIDTSTNEEETLFLGRVLTRTENFDGSLTCQCEGLLACLNDTMVPPHQWPPSGTSAENIVAAWLAWVLGWHDSEIGLAAHQIAVGACTVTAEGNTMERSAEGFETCWDILNAEGPDSPLGGYLVVRYDGDTPVLDYLAAIEDVCDQEIQMGSNMLDLTGERSGTEMFNAVLAEGADGLTLAGVPNGPQGRYYKSGQFLIDVDQRDTYGLIARHIQWDDATDTSTLLAKAAAALDASSGSLVSTFSVPAVDLALVGESATPLRVAQLVTVRSRAHDLRVQLPVMSLSVDLTDPGRTRVTLGSSAAMISRGGGKAGTVISGGGGGGGDMSNYYTKDETDVLIAEAVDDIKVYYGTCDTVASESTKIVTTTRSDLKLEAGVLVYVTFRRANNSNAIYLDVDGTGVVQVRNFGQSMSRVWLEDEVVACVYDGTYWYMPGTRRGNMASPGIVTLRDAVDSSLSINDGAAATPISVKVAYDRGTAGVNAAATAQGRADAAYTLAETASSNASSAQSAAEDAGTEAEIAKNRATQAFAAANDAQSALATIPRPNLLDNWYFANPVNQRGQMSYTEVGYTIDRWKINGGTLLVDTDGIAWPAGYVMFQIIEGVNLADGQPRTVSYMDSDGAVYSGPLRAGYTLVGDFQFAYDTGAALYIQSTSAVKKMRCVKLELGDTQTLAHQDADGDWALNEVPNYQQELAKCQRYQVVIGSDVGYYLVGVGQARDTSACSIAVSLPVSLRARPSIELTGTFALRNGENYFAVAGAQADTEPSPSGIMLYCATGGLQVGATYEAFIYAGRMIIDANL